MLITFSPTLNRSSALQRFKRGSAIEIRNNVWFLLKTATNVFHFTLCIQHYLLVDTKVLKQSEEAIKLIV